MNNVDQTRTTSSDANQSGDPQQSATKFWFHSSNFRFLSLTGRPQSQSAHLSFDWNIKISRFAVPFCL